MYMPTLKAGRSSELSPRVVSVFQKITDFSLKLSLQAELIDRFLQQLYIIGKV